MNGLYPAIEPYAQGLLAVSDGQRLYWEASGNPTGTPVVMLHGGPGSGSKPSMRRLFDPARYRILAFDQRNCGRSLPHASDPAVDLATNTTAHLIADMEALRAHFGVERWLVYGHSWGTTLGLAYAERYPQHVLGMVLVGVTTTRRSEIDWLYRDIAPLFPAAWERFVLGVPASERDGDLVAAYHRLLNHSDAAVRAQAARDFTAWDTVSASVDLQPAPLPDWSPERMLGRARIVTHYFVHGAWLEPGQLLRDAHKLAGIRGVLVQGRLDLQAPLQTAWELDRAWPESELVLVSDAGHATGDPGMTQAIIAATDRFADVG